MKQTLLKTVLLSLSGLVYLALSVASAKPTVMHDLVPIQTLSQTPTNLNFYKVSGDDPYVIFNIEQQTKNATHLIIDLGDEISDVSLELFFKSENDQFDPYYKLSFTAAKFPVALPLPDNIIFTSPARLRLDINRCSQCSINIKTLPTFSNTSESTTLATVSEIKNGINKLNNTPQPIATDEWALNDIKGKSSAFEVSGPDPYLISPSIMTSTHQLAGVYFKFKTPKFNQETGGNKKPGNIWNNYQLFYQTEKHAFTKQANSTIRLLNSIDDTVEFMIPLHFLSKELPSDSRIEKLRIDVPDTIGQWSLLDVQLIPEKIVSNYESLIPDQLLEIKQQRATGLSLIRKTFLNIVADFWFFISYLLLLILTALFFQRQYQLSK